MARVYECTRMDGFFDPDARQWFSTTGVPAPRPADVTVVGDELASAAALRDVVAGRHLLYRGHYVNALQLLAAMRRRLARPASSRIHGHTPVNTLSRGTRRTEAHRARPALTLVSVADRTELSTCSRGRSRARRLRSPGLGTDQRPTAPGALERVGRGVGRPRMVSERGRGCRARGSDLPALRGVRADSWGVRRAGRRGGRPRRIGGPNRLRHRDGDRGTRLRPGASRCFPGCGYGYRRACGRVRPGQCLTPGPRGGRRRAEGRCRQPISGGVGRPLGLQPPLDPRRGNNPARPCGLRPRRPLPRPFPRGRPGPPRARWFSLAGPIGPR